MHLVDKISQLIWQRRSNRDRAILRSVFTAVGAKGCGILLQIVAIPYTIRTLGLEVYGTYAAAVALFGWVSMLEVGLGASLIRGMVAAMARKDGEAASSLFATGIAMAGLLVTVIGSTLIILAGVMISMGHGNAWSNALPLFVCAGCLAGLQIVTGMAARARAAFQETHINNIFGALANLVSALLLWLLIKPGVTALTILAALNMPLIIAQVCNGVALVGQKPLLRSRWQLNWSEGWQMLREGGWLTIGQGGVFLERQAPMLVLTVSATVALVGKFACAVQLLLISAGLVTMISSPLMPAIVDSIHAGESSWWRRRVIILVTGIFLAGLVGIGIMALYGPRYLGILFGQNVNFTSNECAGLTGWTTTVLASHVLYTVLVAAGRLKPVAVYQITQGIFILCAFVMLHSLIGLGGIFWIATLVTLLTTFLPWVIETRSIVIPNSL